MVKLSTQALFLFVISSMCIGSFSIDTTDKCVFSTHVSEEVEQEAKTKLAPLIGRR